MKGRLGTCVISLIPRVDKRSYVYLLTPLPGVGIIVIQSRNPMDFTLEWPLSHRDHTNPNPDTHAVHIV